MSHQYMYVLENKTSVVVTMYLVPIVAPTSCASVGCRRDTRKVRWCVKSGAVPDGGVLVVRCVLFGKR